MSKSTNDAKSALILGHTSSGMGEKSLAVKFKKAIEQAGFCALPILDILEVLKEDYEPLAKLNYDLADVDFPLMEDLKPPPLLQASDLLLILSWCFSVAALLATGIHKTRPTAVKLYAHHSDERILTKLYEPADLVITESLLANERALNYGLAPEKVLYLPHSFPAECADIKANRSYVERLAKAMKKPFGKNTKVIGCVGRLEYGKNYEFAVEAIRRLAAEKMDLVLILKGDFPSQSPYPDYQPLFAQMLEAYKDEPWLFWDKKPTSFPEVLQEYASFDLLLHPSGAEGGSHVVVECLGLKKPVVLLECSTNPYLFKGVASFVKTTQEIRPALVPFYIPDMEDLCKKLKKELKAPDFSLVEERFHERALIERIPLLFEPDGEIIKKLYADDRKRYAL